MGTIKKGVFSTNSFGRSIKGKLLIFNISIISLIMILILSTVIYNFKDFSKKTTYENSNVALDGFNSIIEKYKFSSKSYAEMFALDTNVSKAIESKNSEEILKVIEPISKHTNVDFVTITDEKGIVITRTHEKDKKGDSIINQFNVKKALEGSCESFIETGTVVKLSVRSGAPVKNVSGQIVGVISTGYDMTKTNLVDDIKKAHMVDATIFLNDTRISTTIMKDGKRIIDTKIDEKIGDIVLKQGKRYNGKTEILGEPFGAAYMPIMGPENKPIGLIFTGTSLKAADKVQNKIIFGIIGISILGTLIFIICASIWSNKKIIRPLLLINKNLKQMSSGILNIDFNNNTSDLNEMKQLTENIHITAINISKMINTVKNNFSKIDKNVDNLSNISEEMHSSTSNVSATVHDMAEGNTKQASDMVEISKTLDDFGKDIEKIVLLINDIGSNTKNINSISKESSTNMHSLSESVNDISASFSSFASKFDSFGNNIEQINQITSIINTIADQTNLLALNAAIEAARAGESGKGFAVVAEEIRTLAEQSKSSSEKITNLIKGISSDSKEMIATTDNMNKKMDDQIKTIDTAVNSFNNIINAVDDVTPKIDDIASFSQNIKERKDGILEKIEQTSAIAEEISASSEEIAASSQEMNNASLEVAHSAEDLISMTKDVSVEIGKFKL